ncbi:MAG: hypothetical protein Q9220_002340 [cf. Caloplaca sp. 1 TL-2023]
MVSTLPDAAGRGFTNASSYDAHRPSYPPEAVDCLLTKLQVKGVENACIVDLGAGTGKFSQLLASREERYEIFAVEPHDNMRQECEAKNLQGVNVINGDARNMPVDKQSADAVIAAQAFHWFATDEALEEIYRVLIPGGNLGMIWNVEDYNAPMSWQPRTAWESKLKDIMWSYDDQHPRFRHDSWRKVFDKQLMSSPFTIQSADPLFSLPIGEDSVDFTHWMHPEAIWERYRSLSQIAVLEGDELGRVKEAVFAAMNAPDVEKASNGKLALHGRTVYAWASSVPGAPLKDGG